MIRLKAFNKFRVFNICKHYRMFKMFRKTDELKKLTIDVHNKFINETIDDTRKFIVGREDIFLKGAFLLAEKHLSNMKTIYETEGVKNAQEIRESAENFKEWLYEFLVQLVPHKNISEAEIELENTLEILENQIVSEYHKKVNKVLTS